MEKWPILDKNRRQKKKMPKKAFFAEEYHKKHFPALDCPRKKKIKK